MVDFLTTIDSDRGPIEPLPVTLVSQGLEVSLATLLSGIASPNQTARLVSSAANTNALNLKSSATRLVGVMGYNANAEGRYLKLYNKATTPTVGTDIPALITTVDTVVDAIKVKPDQFVFTVANQVDANALSGGGGLDAAGVRAAVGLASANLDTQLSTIDTVVDSVLVDTNELQTDWANGGRLDVILDARASQSSVDTIDGIVDAILVDTAEIGAAGAGLTSLASAANLATLTGYVDTEVAAIKAKTDNLPIDPADQSAVEAAITAATSPLATAANLATVAGYLDTEIAAILEDTGTTIPSTLASLATQSSVDTIDSIVDSILVDTAVIGAAGAGLTAVPAMILDLTDAIEAGLTPRQALRLITAASAGKVSGAATTSVTIRNAVADSKDRIVATVDASGNRSAITTDLT